MLLARALASVLLQTHRDWHLYLVNDGGAVEPIERLVQRHDAAFAGRITVVHHSTSQGMEAASNAALARAEGDFIVVHDDDDSWHPEFLATTVAFLNLPDHRTFAAVLTNCTVVHERIEGDTVLEDRREAWSFFRRHIDAVNLLSRNCAPPISILIRKSVADAVGSFNAAMPVLGDWDYALRILLVGDIATIDQPLAYYHHRRPAEASNYGNSVGANADRHIMYDTLYRNSLVRALLQRDPAYLGLIHVLMRHAEEQQRRPVDLLEREMGWARDRHADLHVLLLDIIAKLNEIWEILDRVNMVLWPARAVWRRALPVRRLIARLRGRI